MNKKVDMTNNISACCVRFYLNLHPNLYAVCFFDTYYNDKCHMGHIYATANIQKEVAQSQRKQLLLTIITTRWKQRPDQNLQLRLNYPQANLMNLSIATNWLKWCFFIYLYLREFYMCYVKFVHAIKEILTTGVGLQLSQAAKLENS